MSFLHKVADKLDVMTASDGCQLSEVIHPHHDGTAEGLSLARAWLPPSGRTRPHSLEFLEVYYVLSGRGIMHLDDTQIELGPESCVYVPPGSRQWLENLSQSEEISFLCICQPAYDPAKDHALP